MSAERTVPLLVVAGVSAGYVADVDIITDVDLVCEEGELVGIIGPNGAGKSTLVKALFGLVDVRRGSVTFRGEDITSLPAHAMVQRGVGYVPQVRNVFSTLSVEDNLRMGAYLAPARFRERKEAVVELFPVLADRLGTQAGSLSGGQRQMLAMARALMTEPAVLLLDEPSAGLSPIMQDQVFDWIEGINDAGTAVVMVEQNARRCLQICDRGYVLDAGSNAYEATGEQLLRDPKVIELYLGSLARVD
ncbi:MAG TPA: ABC transporter ATP-binding protein [Acidimicrobiia bacterium]|nr:ABC transporter ATP-binding protein [Acidimicrobiia bacterium]